MDEKAVVVANGITSPSSRSQRVKPCPWLSVVRHFNMLLKLIYGPAYKKTYKRAYEGSRFRKRRVYRIPLLEE